MITATVIHLQPEDFTPTFEAVNFSNYARFAKSETLSAIEQADMVLLGDVVLKSRTNGTLGRITAIVATR